MIYADFDSVFVPEDYRRQNSEEFYSKWYQKHAVCSYGYNLEYLDDKFSKPFKSYLGEDGVYKFFNSTIKESKYSINVMKKYLNEELVIAKKDDEAFENSAKCWICDNIENNSKVRDHCHIAAIYRG